jgi:hypothetical protein
LEDADSLAEVHCVACGTSFNLLSDETMEFDAGEETLRCTNLGRLGPGSKINLERSAFVDVRVFNTMGAQVQQVYNGRLADGEHIMTIDASNLPSGTYATIISVDDRAYTIRLVVQ